MAILLLGVLDYIPDTGEARAIVRLLLGLVAVGSFLVLSHLAAEACVGAMTEAVASWNERGSPPITVRTPGNSPGSSTAWTSSSPASCPAPAGRPDPSPFEAVDVSHFCGAARKGGEQWSSRSLGRWNWPS